ncbi:unnamed protein product [Ambrosiozyma monospora]|uniref:Unnamed protein product n=1 Tax=Ambrosiozyma monospora TaxID=43982 RepID=A0A9W7DCF2_AMBMO|nr:unnamed protein product [Ambrosiozyma monospora]
MCSSSSYSSVSASFQSQATLPVPFSSQLEDIDKAVISYKRQYARQLMNRNSSSSFRPQQQQSMKKYIQKEKKIYDQNLVIQKHLNAYLGIKDDEIVHFLDDFLDTLVYCLSIGAFRNFGFAKYCFDSFVFKDDEYNTFITASFLMNGEYEKELYLNERMLLDKLFLISDDNLIKLTKFNEIKNIVAYLCILKEKKHIFEMLDKPELTKYSKILIHEFRKPNYFEIEFEREIMGWSYKPIYTNHKKVYNQARIYENIFEQKLDKEELEIIYGLEVYGNTIKDYSRIENFDQYIFDNYELQQKYNDKSEIFTDIRCLKYAYVNNENMDLVASKLLNMNPNKYEDILEKHDPFIIHINSTYDIKIFTEIEAKYIWGMVYSNTLNRIKIDKDILIKFGYVEYSCFEAALFSGYATNEKRFEEAYNKTKKCIKILDVINKKYVEEEMSAPEKTNVKLVLPEFISF